MKKIAFTEQARADVRRLDVLTAMRIFAGIHRFAETGAGDVNFIYELLERMASEKAPRGRSSRTRKDRYPLHAK